MRIYAIALATAAFFASPTSVLSQISLQFGPGGVRVHPGYHDHHGYGYDRHYGRDRHYGYDRYGHDRF